MSSFHLEQHPFIAIGLDRYAPQEETVRLFIFWTTSIIFLGVMTQTFPEPVLRRLPGMGTMVYAFLGIWLGLLWWKSGFDTPWWKTGKSRENRNRVPEEEVIECRRSV